jgi:hypothetical protein
MFLGIGTRNLESRLRAERAKAPDALVDSIASRVTPRRQTGGFGARLSFAASVAVLVLGSFASFGGIGYAATATHATVHTVKQLAVAHHVTVHHSSAGSQYNKPITNVGKPPAAPSAGQVLGTQSPVKAQGTLPFTGISLGVTVALSLLLMGLGVMLRRRGDAS